MTTAQATKLEELEIEGGQLDNLLSGLTQRIADARRKLRERVSKNGDELKNSPDPGSLRIRKGE